MRLLLMIGNSNMAARELYGMVLRNRFPGWGVSNMSGLPSNPGAIIQAYDAIVYELDAPSDPRRYRAVLALWDEIKTLGTVRLITHIEGPYREGMVAELESRGVLVVDVPFSPRTIADTLQRIAPIPPARPPRGGGRLRDLFRRGAPRSPSPSASDGAAEQPTLDEPTDPHAEQPTLG